MEVELDIRKSVQENAAEYFEKAKKLKKKLEGIKKTIAENEAKLEFENQKQKRLEEKSLQKTKKAERKKEWFEKFRWFVSSDNFLCVGGRDATTNDILIKKQTSKNDLVFHTDIAGSPFVVVKNPENRKIPETTKQECADFCATFSRAWKRGVTSTEVYAITPEQVSKEAKSGEYLEKGSFMIYGKREYFAGKMSLSVGIYNDMLLAGPFEAVKKHCSRFVTLVQGDKKLSDIAKKLQKKIGGEIDEIVRALPQGVDLRK